jgi:chaperonin GroES
MSLRPILGKIIVKPQDAEQQTSGGLIIANAKNDGIIQGEVVAVGPGEYDEKGNFVKPSVQPGNTILLHTMAGHQFEYDDEKYQTISGHEVVAVLS